METGKFINAAGRMIVVTALVAGALLVLLVGGGLMTGPTLGAGATGAGESGNARLGEFGGYLMLVLLNVGLGTVVAWMLFGKRE